MNQYPIKKNIEVVFQKLIFSLASASGYKEYEKSHQDLKHILDVVINWIIIYSNTKDLNQINKRVIINIKQRLFELDGEYLLKDEWYIQQAYEWLLQLELLIEKNNSDDVMNPEI